MKRILFLCAVALLSGMYVMALLPQVFFITGLLFLILLCLVGSYFTKHAVLPCFLVCAFLLGALHMHAALDIENRPLQPYVNEYIEVEANSTKKPEQKDGYFVLWAEIRSVSFMNETVTLREKVRLTVDETEPIPDFGESFKAVCLLSVPKTAMNEGGFDFQTYLKTKDVFFNGQIERGTLLKTGRFSFGLTDYLYSINLRLGETLEMVLPHDAASVLRAVALGDTSGFSEAFSEALSVSGLSHVTSVSGMHVATLMSFVYILLSLLGRNRYRYVWLSGGVILSFMLLVGAGPSVVRAAVMGLMAMIAAICNRRADELTSLGFAAALLALIQPAILMDVGFIFSFAATLGIILFAKSLEKCVLSLTHLEGKYTGLFKVPRVLVSTFAVTIAAQLFTLPVSAGVFGTFSIWSFITNLLVSPLVICMLLGGLLVSVLGLIHPLVSQFVAGFFYPFVKLFLLVVEFFGTKAAGLLTVGSFSNFALYVYGLLAFSLYKLIEKKKKMPVIPVMAAVVLLCLHLVVGLVQGQRAEITFINVGNGDCSLIELPGAKTVLIDGGGIPSYLGGYDIGGQVVLPYLKKAGVRGIDYMVATHAHDDHINGLYSLLDKMDTKVLVIPQGFCDTTNGAALVEKAKRCDTQVLEVTTGEELIFGENSRLEILMPDARWLSMTGNENDKSMVLRLVFGKMTALFTGDLGTDGETYLMATRTDVANCDILKVAHHGADTSSSEAFLKRVAPRYAFIPCGENSFGHPHEDVLCRLEALGTEIYRADEDMNVSFTFDQKGITKIRTGGSRREN